MFKNVMPTINRVLVKMVKPSMKTTSGLILTSAAQDLKWGKIMAVEPGEVKDGPIGRLRHFRLSKFCTPPPSKSKTEKKCQ